MMTTPSKVALPDGLSRLQEGWDGYKGQPPTATALAIANLMCCVPLADGGLQFEFHPHGLSVEIGISPSGVISLNVSQ